MFLYLLDNGVSFDMPKRISEIRNRIVHKGHIASEEEAIEYSELVYSVIRNVERLISEKYGVAAESESAEEVAKRKSMAGNVNEVMVMKVTPAIAAHGQVVGVPETFVEYMVASASGRHLVH